MLRVLLAALAALASPAAAQAYRSTLTPDGRVLVQQQYFNTLANNGGGLVGQARLDQDGKLDRAFGRNGFQIHLPAEELAGAGAQLVTDSEGRTVLAFNGADGTAYVRHLTQDGSIDADFGTRRIAGPDVGLDVAGLTALAGGELLVGGTVPGPAGGGQPLLAVLLVGADGTPVPAFGDGGLATAAPSAPVSLSAARQIHVLGDGRILAGGRQVIARFEPDGSPDEGFGEGGVITSSFDSSVAIDGTATYVTSSPGPPGTIGIVVERLREDGERDTNWGSGGVAEFPLAPRPFDDDNGDDFPDGGIQVSYAPGDLLVLPGGGLVVGAAERVDDFNYWSGGEGGDCPGGRGIPLPVSETGTPGAELPSSGRSVEHLMRAADGHVLVAGSFEHFDSAGCANGYLVGERGSFLARHAVSGEKVNETELRPVDTPPDVTIASGPPAAPGSVTGDPAFRFDVRPGPYDAGDVVLRCTIDDAAWQPCAATQTFTGVPDGPHVLAVRAFGIHGAPSAVREYAWTQNAAAPVTIFSEAPQGQVASRAATIAFAASEPATFVCSVDGAAASPCESPMRLDGLADGPHEVRVTATDALGAVEAAPAAVAWAVATESKPTPSLQPITLPEPAGLPRPRVRLGLVGVRRTGRVRVVVRGPAGARVRVRGRVLREGRRALRLKAARGTVPATGRLRLVLRLGRQARAGARVRVTVVVRADGERRSRTVTRRLP